MRLRHGLASFVLLVAVAGCASSAATPAGPSLLASVNPATSAPATSAPTSVPTPNPTPAPTAASLTSDAPPDVPDACTPDVGSANTMVTFDADQHIRLAMLHVPSKLPAGKVPAVIGLHGFNSSVTQFERYTRLSEKADQSGFIAVYPQALGTPAQWQLPVTGMFPEHERSDHVFLNEVVDWLAASPCVDARRIFLLGHSNGGGMASLMSCELSDRLAGVGLVSAETEQMPCKPPRALPIVVFHGFDDPILPFAGGHINNEPNAPNQLAMDDVMAKRATDYGCAPKPASTLLDTGEPADDGTQLDWTGCAAPLRFFRLSGGGHGWTTMTTTDRLWVFFAALPGR